MSEEATVFIFVGAAWGILAFIRTFILQESINNLRKEIRLLRSEPAGKETK